VSASAPRENTRPGSDHALKRAAIYLRVSTKQQAMRDGNPEGYSLPTQRKLCTELVGTKSGRVVEEYIDTDSGTSTDQRPALKEMLKRISTQRDVDMVVIFKLDRWARNARESLANDWILEQASADLISYSEPFLDRSNAGRMMHAVMAGGSEYTSRNNGDEIRRKTLVKIQEGGTYGAAPLGYKNVGEGGRRWVDPDPQPFELLRWCFYAYATGEWSVEALTDEANNRGLLSKGGPNTPRKPLSPSTMHRRLSSPYYKGIVVYNGVEYQGKHEPLVDAENWQRVQDILSSKRQGLKQRRHHHYLKGTIWCGHCGSRLVVNYTRGKLGKRYPYYMCVGRQQRRTTCMLKARPISTVEDEIAEHYRLVQLNSQGVEEAARAVIDELAAERSDTDQKRMSYETKLKRLEAERHKLLQAHYHDAVPLDLLKSEQARIAGEIASTRSALKGAVYDSERIEETAERAVSLLKNCHTTYEDMSPQERRLMNQAFFSKIWVTEDGVVGWEYQEPFASLLRRHQAKEPIFITGEQEIPRDERSRPRQIHYQRRSPGHEARASLRWGLKDFNLAEGVGFEPTVSCPTHAFQACRFGRSRIPPYRRPRNAPRAGSRGS
jgi:site-specific DNA recombinase